MMLRIYEQQLDAQLINNATELITVLEYAPQEEWENLLMIFSVENNVGVTLLDENDDAVGLSNSAFFASEENQDFDSNISLGFEFEQNNQYYFITITSGAVNRALTQIEGIFTQIFLYVFIVICLVAVLTALLYARFLGQPIIEIAHISKKMANLDMLWHCKTNRTDEIGMLANNLNQMANQLATTLEDLQAANIKLQNDVEKERERERRRRDFFIAVSHELKTPVTILKGELDGMILNIGKFKNRDKYLQEAYKTSESIERLVREIMILVKLDTISLNVEQVNLSYLINEVVKLYEPLAREKQIDVQINSETDVFLQADQAQLQTVVSNMISNAVKHSPYGQSVKINLAIESELGYLTVENKGVHIEEDEIFKLWDPFYRTDKSRSRDTGGSGLGLYIVKTILDLHRFSYKLENCENGIRFTMNFPIDSKK